MPTKQVYAMGSFKYRHRMLRAGDPVEMSGPDARLYEHLGKVSGESPGLEPAKLEDFKKADLLKLASVDEKDAKKFTKAALIEKIKGA